MAKDFFENFFSNGVLGDEFFKALDDVTKNIQTNVHTVCEKWKNGELVSKDEEKYENGKKTLDVHQSKRIDGDNPKLDGASNKDTYTVCKCDPTKYETDKPSEVEKAFKELETKYKSCLEELANCKEINSSLAKNNEILKEKLGKFKQLFEAEF